MRLTRYFVPKVIAVVALSLAAVGQQSPQPQQQADDDSFDPDSVNRGVARISIMNGDVSVRRGDSGEYVAAAINSPVVAGDRVLTGPNSSAEVQFDSANMIRIASDSEIRLAELGDRRYLIQLAHGLATFRVLRPSEADVEVSTPQVSVRPRKEGVYRLLVRDNGESSEVTVRAGEVEVFTPSGVETVRAGRTMQVRGTASDPEYQIVSALAEDDWDRWNRNRDQDLERSASYRYVNPDIDGADDLDNYGQWVSDPAYGNVWSPRVAAGWAPYREGRWVWIDWYGWTWVSYDPWGWAPYHYGRWYQSARYGWCWYPGALRGRHYWSPGLVAFVGFGGGGVGVGFNHIGWVPLAPHERYHRWYGRGFYGGNRGFGNVTVVNNTNIHNSYRNARNTNAVSTIEAARFGRGESGRAWRSSDGDFQRASLVQGQLPVAPGRESLRLTDRDARGGIVSRSAGNERFVSRRQPTQVERVPFEQQRRNFEQSRSGVNPGVVGGGVRQQPSYGSWRRFGDPSTGTPRTQQPGVAPGAQRGSGGFGQPSATQERNLSRTQPSRPEGQSLTQPQAGRSTPGNDNRRRFEGNTAPSPGATNAPGVANPRGDRSGFGRPERQASPNSNGYRSAPPESVRISPPVVRERSPSRSESAPSFRASPRSESPRPSGGGGGGGRPSFGGGGARPSGGGSGHNGGGGGRSGGGRR